MERLCFQDGIGVRPDAGIAYRWSRQLLSGDRVGCRTARLCVACGGVAGMGARPWRRWPGEPVNRKRFIDDHLGRHVRQFTPLPSFHLFSPRLEVSLHSIDANRNAVDERERLRMFCEHGSEHT